MSQATLKIRRKNHKMEGSAEKYSNRNQFAGLIFLAIVLGTIAWGVWVVIGWMKDPYRLPLTKLVVTGARYYTTNDDIRQAIWALGGLGAFMTQDVEVIQQQIERMPWVKQANVRKQWPDELQIHVVEYVPVVLWNDLHLLDGRGKIFSAPVERISKHPLPMLYGPEGSEQDVLVGYYAMNEVLTAAKFRLKAVSMSSRHSWQLTLKDDIRLELGRDNRASRLQRFVWIYPMLLQQARKKNKRIGYVDLRYDSGLAVGWTVAYIEPENSNQQQTQVQAEQ